MDSSVIIFVVAILAAIAIISMITAMIVGSVRNSRGDRDWSHRKDKDFLPWSKDADDLK